MAVMGASLEKSGVNGGRCFYSKLLQQALAAEKVALKGRLARDAARRIV
jgi:hypothetical protein